MDITAKKCWAGLDWGDKEHCLCVISENAQCLCRECIPHNAEGVSALMQTLKHYEGLAGVAIETSKHVLVDALLREGFKVYPINPKMAHAWRGCVNVAGAKNDMRDAHGLANGLRLFEMELRPLELDDPPMRVLAALCEQEQKLIEQRTALVCELEAVLKTYFPAILAWFDQWTQPGAWRFVQTFSTPELLANAKKDKLYRWFKGNRLALTQQRREHIEQRAAALRLTGDPALHAVYAMRAVALAGLLLSLENSIALHRKEIERRFPEISQSEIFSSLPGAGPKLAPRLAVIFGSTPERFEDANSVCELCGAVPVERTSGNSRSVRFRRACRKSYRNTLHQYAWVSIRFCAWAKTYYTLCRNRNQSHSLALRNLAVKWINIIFRMWQNNTRYDEQKYRAALKKSKSPVAAALAL